MPAYDLAQLGNRDVSPHVPAYVLARAFADDGYLKTYDVDRDGEPWWESTIKGSALILNPLFHGIV